MSKETGKPAYDYLIKLLLIGDSGEFSVLFFSVDCSPPFPLTSLKPFPLLIPSPYRCVSKVSERAACFCDFLMTPLHPVSSPLSGNSFASTFFYSSIPSAAHLISCSPPELTSKSVSSNWTENGLSSKSGILPDKRDSEPSLQACSTLLSFCPSPFSSLSLSLLEQRRFPVLVELSRSHFTSFFPVESSEFLTLRCLQPIIEELWESFWFMT